MASEINPVKLPDFLMTPTIGTMPVEEPHYPSPNYIYVRHDTGELFLGSDDELPKKSDRPKKLVGSVAVMRAAIIDSDNTLLSGYVADMRNIKSASKFESAPDAEVPDDNEEAQSWREFMKYMEPIAAIVYSDKSMDVGMHTRGDERFAKAALHLASLTDAMATKIKEKKSQTKSGQTVQRQESNKTKPDKHYSRARIAVTEFAQWLGFGI